MDGNDTHSGLSAERILKAAIPIEEARLLVGEWLGIVKPREFGVKKPEKKTDDADVPIDLARADFAGWNGAPLKRLSKGAKSALEFAVSDKPDAVRKKTGMALVATIVIIPLVALNALWVMVKSAPSNQKKPQGTEAVQQKKESAPVKAYAPPFAIPNEKKMWMVAPGAKQDTAASKAKPQAGRMKL
ncbi:MAG: hypothetical protein WC861_01265 [Candidatus Micrarchaeia archaeon]|jgi:hypothetical protein